MNETMPISAGLPAGMTTDACLEAQLRSAFLTGETDGEEAGLRPEFVINDPDRRIKVLTVIEDELARCTSFDISVAFVTMSGIEPLLPIFEELRERGVPGRVLTTDYLCFSDPAAMRKLAGISNIEVRLFRAEGNRGFHTKGYIFNSGDVCRFLIGSSNLTGTALATNREWNARLVSKQTGAFARALQAEFRALWDHPLSRPLHEVIDAYEAERRAHMAAQTEVMRRLPLLVSPVRPEPNSMQRAFVENLLRIAGSGERRALLISATGTGKTYAAAFAVRELKPRRMLFVVHREQIARQAMASFRRVLGEDELTYGLLGGGQNEAGADCVFATMQTLARERVLGALDPKAFDVIIIDEVHRAAAESYKKIMAHFEPKLWFGMTASPDRPDGADIYALFDHNIAYEIRLSTALEEDLLCPFHYFGVKDVTVGGMMLEDLSDFRLLTAEERVSNILDRAQYFGWSGPRVKGLVFCSRKEECAELSRLFNERGLMTVALTGEDEQSLREEAIYRLSYGVGDNRLDYIFTVDIFAEGVDIPEVNQVIMLRPTQSAIVFVQQLGRGLRKAPDKEFVVILDFIGNYQSNFLIPVALADDRSYNKDNMRRALAVDLRQIPGASSVHFDPIVRKRIYESIDRASVSDTKLIRTSYEQLKAKLGRIPELLDFDRFGSIDAVKFFEKFGSYYAFLEKYEKSFTTRLSTRAAGMLAFLSVKAGAGRRVSEAIVIRDLLAGRPDLETGLREGLARYGIEPSAAHLSSVFGFLSNRFVKTADEAKQRAGMVFVEYDAALGWRMAAELCEELGRSAEFRTMLAELAGFMVSRYEARFSKRYAGTDLVLYEKYTYEDVCRLLNWPTNMNAQNIGGYFYEKTTKTMPVFVNYHKAEGAIAYEDRFVSPSHIVALSKTKRRTTSADADHIYKRTPEDKDNRILLFVRRNKEDKGEAKAFYFLGEVEAQGEPVPVTLPATGDRAFEIEYRLDVPVRSDIYAYVTMAED